MSEASTFFEGEKVDNLDTWMPTDPREKTFLSYITKDGKEIVSRSRAFLAYPKKMKTGIYSFINYSHHIHYNLIFFQVNGAEGLAASVKKVFLTELQ